MCRQPNLKSWVSTPYTACPSRSARGAIFHPAARLADFTISEQHADFWREGKCIPYTLSKTNNKLRHFTTSEHNNHPPAASTSSSSSSSSAAVSPAAAAPNSVATGSPCMRYMRASCSAVVAFSMPLSSRTLMKRGKRIEQPLSPNKERAAGYTGERVKLYPGRAEFLVSHCACRLGNEAK